MEAALLPRDAVSLGSEPAVLGWGSSRRYRLEVYLPGPSSSGTEAAPAIKAVGLHVLVAAPGSTGRRVYDLFASAPNWVQLASLEPVLERMLQSASLTE
jgi:hypothetical protein